MSSLDRTAFKAFKASEHTEDITWWKDKSATERLEAAYYLITVAYGIDPQNPPRMDKTVFEARKRK